MFKEISEYLKPSYNSNRDDISNEFYNRVLAESISFDRVSGYFSAKALATYADGLDKLVNNNGKVRFIISTDISEKDFFDIRKGYTERSQSEKLTENDKKRLGNLAYLIATGQAEVKFGLISNGIFHSKWGLFADNDNEFIYFNGSNNETYQALNANFEDFDVDFSWDTSINVSKRIRGKRELFEQLWNNNVPNVEVVSGNDIVYEVIKKYDVNYIQYLPGKNENIVLLDFDEADESGGLVLIDKTKDTSLKNPKIKLPFIIDYYINKEKGFPFIAGGFNYREIEDLIRKVKRKLNKVKTKLVISQRLKRELQRNKYSIEHFEEAGITIKNRDKRWDIEYNHFKDLVSTELDRPLKPLQMRAAFYMYTQKRAANFSVPGAGKTAMLLGVFAYLNRQDINQVDRILVISPINAFMSWRDEFKIVFGSKKELFDISIHDENVNEISLRAQWSRKNLVLVNFESLPKYAEAIVAALKNDGGRTMIVFDEVHRIKGIGSVRAEAALNVAKYAQYKYVLTGTPIPNTYQDIWNFLHILFGNEYDSFFGFDKSQLKSPDIMLTEEINDKINPFFWRTNKKDLGVPQVNDDIIYRVKPSLEQLRLAETIFNTESNPLAIMIRMLQLSTNPELLSQVISLSDLGYSGEMDKEDSINSPVSNNVIKKLQLEIRDTIIDRVSDINLNSIVSPKFTEGIKVVEKLVHENKKVIVWGLFVGTINKINEVLRKSGIKSAVVYGATGKSDRDAIINRFKDNNNNIQVLISNPNTLGESISLHQTVHDAVYFEYNYNLTYMLQSRDRIHRLGLSDGVETNYHYLMTVSNQEVFNFIDEKVYDALHEKEQRMKVAIDTGILVPQFSDEEFNEMKQIIDSERP